MRANSDGWRLPRLTRRAFVDLAVYGMAVGALTGLAFPLLLTALGMPRDLAYDLGVRTSCVVAGLLVAGVNHALARLVVGARLRRLSRGMRATRAALDQATQSGRWDACDPAHCHVEVDSDDDFGVAARSHNALVDAVAHAHDVERSITEITTALASQLDVTTLCRTALVELLRRTGTRGAAIAVQCHAGLEIVHAGTLEDLDTLSGTATAAIAHYERSGATRPGPLPHHLDEAWTIVPLRAPSQVLGVLLVPHQRPLPSVDPDRVLTNLATSLGIALSNALLHQRLTRLATTDELTGLPNRRTGLATLSDALARAAATSGHLGVAMIDIDHFKRVNDEHGHLVGDLVLAHVAQVCRAAQRCGDELFRYGGEEFLAIMPGLPPERLAAASERLRAAVESSPFLGVPGVVLTLTISIGAACHHPGFDDPGHHPNAPRALLQRADEALYRAKNEGRNAVSTGSEPRSPDQCVATAEPR